MSDSFERLRRLQGLRPQRSQPELTYIPIDDAGDPLPPRPTMLRGRLEELLPGAVLENAAGACYVTTTATPLAAPRGDGSLAAALTMPPATLAAFHPAFRLEAARSLAGAAFVDTETTGLVAGGGG